MSTATDTSTLGTAEGRFRAAALAEAVSWGALLVAMFFKYVVVKNEVGVQVVGPIHGTLFVVYVVLTLLVARSRRWSAGVTLVGVLASIPPFGTLVFERWVERTGRLSGPVAR